MTRRNGDADLKAPSSVCIFRPKAATDSGSIRPPIPVQSGHRFRLIPATFWEKPESETTLDNFEESGHDGASERRTAWHERGYP